MWRGEPIEPADLGLRAATRASESDGLSLDERMLHTEVDIVAQALRHHSGRRDATARALGISVRTLRHKLQRWRDMGIHLVARVPEEALT